MGVEKKTDKKSTFEIALGAYSQAMDIFHQGDFKKSRELLGKFAKEYPSERELVDRASIYMEICSGRLDKSVIKSETFEDYYHNGVFLLNQNKFDEALDSFDHALNKKPKEGQLYYLKALAFHMKKEDEKCLENLKKAVDLDNQFAILAQNESDFEDLQNDQNFMKIIEV